MENTSDARDREINGVVVSKSNCFSNFYNKYKALVWLIVIIIIIIIVWLVWKKKSDKKKTVATEDKYTDQNGVRRMRDE
jgi:t-SNARE complex subunit (syntaxin)